MKTFRDIKYGDKIVIMNISNGNCSLYRATQISRSAIQRVPIYITFTECTAFNPIQLQINAIKLAKTSKFRLSNNIICKIYDNN